MRSEATLKNSIWGIAQQVIVCVLSLFSRRVMIDTIGIEGVGLNAFLNSVISMMSLAELGIGSAIIYHMYAPIAKGDRERVAKLMHAYKIMYRLIAAVILLVGICLLPLLDRIVDDVSYSRGYVSLIFILFLIQTTSSYLFTYKRSMLSADQKQYIITMCDLVYKTVTVFLGIAVLKITGELAYYIIMLTVCTVAENIFISAKVNKMYPYLGQMKGKLPRTEVRGIAHDVKNIFIGKLSGVITTSTDSVLINILVGTVQNGLYSNYNIILGTLSATLRQFSDAMRGSVGNLIAVEEPGHINKVFSRLMFIMFFIASFCACCLTGLVDPFVTLAFGKGLLLERYTVYVCILNLYMSAVTIPIYSMVAAAGLFKTDKYISVAGSLTNLILSFFLGRKIGMTGILIGTAATYIVQFVLKIILFYGRFLKLSSRAVFLKNIVYAGAVFLECMAVEFITGKISIKNPYAEFAVFGVISCAVPVAVNTVLFFKTEEFSYSAEMVLANMRRILHK